MACTRTEAGAASKRVIIAGIGLPSSDETAGQAVMEGLVKAFTHHGYVVDYIAVSVEELGISSLTKKRISGKHQTIHEIKAVSSRRGGRIDRLLNISNQGYSYQLDGEDTRSLEASIEGNYYTVAVFFESITFGLSNYVTSPRKVFIQGDPCGKRYRFGLRKIQVISHVMGLIMGLGESLFLKRISKEGTIGLFGTEHAKSLSVVLKKPVLDLRPWLTTSVERSNIHEGRVGGRTTIYYFGGTLEGTASRFALDVLCEHAIPLMQKVHGANGYEVRIVGRANQRAKERIGDNSQVRFTGFVPSFPNELIKGDIFILVSKYWIGVRTRVCDALAAGLICIVHESIFRNMPELKRCRAVFACSDMTSVEEALRKVASLSDAERQSLRMEAIKHYESNYECCREGSILGILGGTFDEGRVGSDNY